MWFPSSLLSKLQGSGFYPGEFVLTKCTSFRWTHLHAGLARRTNISTAFKILAREPTNAANLRRAGPRLIRHLENATCSCARINECSARYDSSVEWDKSGLKYSKAEVLD